MRSCILANTTHRLHNTFHSLSLILLAGGEDGTTSAFALEVDNLLLLPLQPDLAAPSAAEDRLQAGADWDEDCDEGSSHSEEAAGRAGNLRPKDDAAVDPPKHTNSQPKNPAKKKMFCRTRQ